jgi:TRAP-type C4-dicarboxylate transport system permease small subunit
MKPLRALESTLVRIEGAVAVAVVLTMLALAGYNVFYRNVLVPLQKHWAHSGPTVVADMPAVVRAPGDAATPSKAEPGSPTPTRDDGAEGFGGDWGEDGASEPTPVPPPSPKPSEPAAAPDEGAEGFGGDWGEDDGAAPEPTAAGDARVQPAEPGAVADDELADEDDPFAHLQRIEGSGTKSDAADAGPQGGPPPEGSFAAWAVGFVDRIKLGWIDVVLRQLVILIAFFGGMLATHRGKHINVDALSKVLGARARRVLGILTNLLALGVCLVLARAGSQLVAISREYPRELVPGADEWVFQLMYPFGFGLLAFHFAVRVAEAVAGLPGPGETQPATELPIQSPIQPPIQPPSGGGHD